MSAGRRQYYTRCPGSIATLCKTPTTWNIAACPKFLLGVDPFKMQRYLGRLVNARLAQGWLGLRTPCSPISASVRKKANVHDGSPRPARLGRFRPRLSEALVPFPDERLHRRPAGYNLLLPPIGPAF